MYVPAKLFFTKGVGTHREKFTSFELALRDARIACYNLVRVSSIFPAQLQGGLDRRRAEAARARPDRPRRDERERARPSPTGWWPPASAWRFRATGACSATSRNITRTARRPRPPPTMPKTLPPRCSPPCSGVEFNPDSSWDEKREIWKIADVFYKTKEITQTAVGHKDGLWSTVVAAASSALTGFDHAPDLSTLPRECRSEGGDRASRKAAIWTSSRASACTGSLHRRSRRRDRRRPDRPGLLELQRWPAARGLPGLHRRSSSSPTAPSV